MGKEIKRIISEFRGLERAIVAFISFVLVFFLVIIPWVYGWVMLAKRCGFLN